MDKKMLVHHKVVLTPYKFV